jgi:hypothetical protein
MGKQSRRSKVKSPSGKASSSKWKLPDNTCNEKKGSKQPSKTPKKLRVRTAHAMTTTHTRTPQQETALLRALGVRERPKYPMKGEDYRMDFSEFRQHVRNKIPLYDGRAVTTSHRKPRHFRIVCALHPACPFFIQSKQCIHPDGLLYQEIRGSVNHTCSPQSHKNTSLCSANFLEYFLRDEQLPSIVSRPEGLDAGAEIGNKFGVDFTSLPRRQMLNKVIKTRNNEGVDAAFSALRSPSPICVAQNPLLSLEPSEQTISNPQVKRRLVGGNGGTIKKSKIHDASSPEAAKAQSNSILVPQSTPKTTQKSARKTKIPEYLRLLENYTARVDEMSPRSSRAPCSGSSTPTNQHSGAKTDRLPSLVAKSEPPLTPHPRRSLKVDGDELADDLSSTVDSSPARRTRACTSKVHSSSEKRQPESKQDEQSSNKWNQQPSRKLTSQRKKLVDDLSSKVDSSPSQRTRAFTSKVHSSPEKSQPESKQAQQSSSQANQQPSRKLTPKHKKVVDDLSSKVDSSPSQRTRAFTSKVHSSPEKRQPGSKQDQQSSSQSNQQPSRNLTPEHKKLVDAVASAGDSSPPRRTRASCTSTDAASTETCATKDSKQDAQSSSQASQQLIRKRKLERVKLPKNLTPALDDLPPRRLGATNTAASTETCAAKQKLESKQDQQLSSKADQQLDRKLKPQREKLLDHLTPAIDDLPPRRSGATNTAASTDKVAPKRQPDSNEDKQSNSKATQQTNRKLKLEREKLVDGLTPAMEDLPPRRSGVSNAAASTGIVTVNGRLEKQPSRKLRSEHQKALPTSDADSGQMKRQLNSSPDTHPSRTLGSEHGRPVLEDLPLRKTRASSTELSCKLRSEDGRLEDNLRPVLEELPPRKTRASSTELNCKLRSEDGRLEDNLRPVLEELPPRKTRASSTKLSCKLRSKDGRLVDNFGPVLEDPPLRKTRASSTELSCKLRSEDGRLVDNLRPVLEDPPLRKTRASSTELSCKLRSEDGRLVDGQVFEDPPPRKTRASSTEVSSTTLHPQGKSCQQDQLANLEAKQLPARKPEHEQLVDGLAPLADLPPRRSRGRSEAEQQPNSKRKSEHEVLLSDSVRKKPKVDASRPKLTGGTAASQNSGLCWTSPGESQKGGEFLPQTSVQMRAPAVLSRIPLVEEYMSLVARDVCEFVSFGPTLASVKKAINLKLRDVSQNIEEDPADKEIEVERVEHIRSLRDFSRLAYAERLAKLQESEEDKHERMVTDYHNRSKRVDPMEAEESAFISLPIRFYKGMEVGRRKDQKCIVGPDCTICQNAQAIQPRKEPLPRFRRFDITQLDSSHESNDSASASGARSRRNRLTRGGKRAASRLALLEMKHSISFVEEFNSENQLA